MGWEAGYFGDIAPLIGLFQRTDIRECIFSFQFTKKTRWASIPTGLSGGWLYSEVNG